MTEATDFFTSKKLFNGLLISGLLLISGAAMAVEEPDYTILLKADNFELRRYDKQLVAQTWVTGDQNDASREGFKVLADYIFGNNTASDGKSSKISMTAPVTMEPKSNQDNGESQKIAMTAPVSMQRDDGKWRVQFTMPSQYTIQTLPKPNNPNIEIKEVPVQNYGVIKFSGLAGTDKVAKKTEELQSWMQSQNLNIMSTPQIARYNPPWTLPFMRRNEVMIAYQPN
ncbi:MULTISPECIES: SOUL family heme-binding protein [unclassified Psychrobacter]|uniref:SOUL family heme-binding protein n=1 Tax=unclassified Psychrobacter TaxID=196806 RepID=UPI003F6DCB93